jgi:hypothetical protein
MRAAGPAADALIRKVVRPMLRRTVVLSGLVMLLATATAVHAQDRRPQGGRGAFGGFGGPGGGFFQASGSQLLGYPEVQKELGVSDEQKGLIDDMSADIREKMRDAFAGGGGFQDFQNLSQDERQKRMEENGKKMAEIQKKSDDMVSMILEPKQLDRLQQLKLQRDGVMALNREEVAKKIGLTQEQREKMAKIQEDARNAAGAGGFPNFQQMSEEERTEWRNKMTERFEKTKADILAVLTTEQRSTWEKMQGKKFDFPPPPGFGGGGVRRPGGER